MSPFFLVYIFPDRREEKMTEPKRPSISSSFSRVIHNFEKQKQIKARLNKHRGGGGRLWVLAHYSLYVSESKQKEMSHIIALWKGHG
jgi:hypothetical protein